MPFPNCTTFFKKNAHKATLPILGATAGVGLASIIVFGLQKEFTESLTPQQYIGVSVAIYFALTASMIYVGHVMRQATDMLTVPLNHDEDIELANLQAPTA